MRPLLAAAAALLLLAAPALAVTQPVAHQTVQAQGVSATFHIAAPTQAKLTCPMHPEVVSGTPGECPACGMALEKQTHHIALELKDARHQLIKGATVRLTVKDAMGMLQGLNLKGDGRYAGDFALMPGAQRVTAYVKLKGASQALELAVPYEAK